MKKIILKLVFVFNLLGIDLIKSVKFLRGIPFYINNYKKLRKQMKIKNEFVFGKFYPILDERKSEGGIMNGHYFHQDLLIAQKIYINKPIRHIDIGSRIDGFVAHVATFREIEIFDIRHVISHVSNIKFKQSNLMQLDSEMISCCDSISSLHAIEHFGLGRYGDPIDINGHLSAINNIHTMLTPNGKFYFSVPIGKQRIEFNAHRVFDVSYLISILNKQFIIDNFNFVNDNGDLFINADLSENSIKNNFGCHYGCGIFELTKK